MDGFLSSSPYLPTSPYICQVMDGFLSSSALARVKPAIASAMAPAEFGAITRSSMEEDAAPRTQPQP